jgi:hypothetical protein
MSENNAKSVALRILILLIFVIMAIIIYVTSGESATIALI